MVTNEGGIIEEREREAGPVGGEERRKRRKRDTVGWSQFRPLLFVFGSARADQTTGDQDMNSIRSL